MKKRIVCFGAGPQFKGGMAHYNTSLAKALAKLPGMEAVTIVSWTQQYPAIIPRDFKDSWSRTDLLEGTNIPVHYLVNYNNPLSWEKAVRFIIGLQPDLVVFQWSIALQGLPLGYMARRLRRHMEVVFDLHFVVQKENSSLDKAFTRFGISKAQTYVVHAGKTLEELEALFPQKKLQVTETGERSENPATATAIKLFHPVYDLHRPDPNFDVAAYRRANGLKQHVFLFFGFIRKYKGLHHAIRAFKILAGRRDDVSLLICGESFWKTLDATKWSTRIKSALFKLAKRLVLNQSDDESNYDPLALIDALNLRDRVMVVNQYVPNEDVYQYFQASDAVLLFYEYATPSGVESLSYNFQLPLLATRVGHFPETIRDGFNGYLAEPGDETDMANVMERFIDAPIPRENVVEASRRMSWENYARAIVAG